jgi:hypothetical protein
VVWDLRVPFIGTCLGGRDLDPPELSSFFTTASHLKVGRSVFSLTTLTLRITTLVLIPRACT